MGDIELRQLLRKARTLVKNARSSRTRKERDLIVNRCESTLKQCKNLIARIEIETRDMQQEDRSEVRKILKERAAILKEISRDCKWAKNSTDNLDENDEDESKYSCLDEMNEDEIIEYGRKIQLE